MSKFISKKFLIKTYGCQANIADSNSVIGMLESLGFEQIILPPSFKDENEALKETLKLIDLFIVNTCSVRQKSEDKVYGLGKIFKRLKKEGIKIPFTVMAGCMVGSVTGDRQRFSFKELKEKTPWVDEYVNPSQIYTIPDLLKRKGILGDWALKKSGLEKDIYYPGEGTKAYVNVSYGCDNFCTFCVVPYARGREVSRTEFEILKEIKFLISRGIKEITLCGQNVNSWGMSMSEKFEIRTGSDHKIPFASLLRKIHEISEIEKISFISSNPFDFGKDLIDAMKLPKISNYVHIAVQSGNDEILKKMNRRHSVREFKNLVSKLRKIKPDLELGTDLIVGFPGETEKQFMDTVELVKKIKFNVAFIAMYSPRKGTPAEKFYKDDVPLKEKRRRHSLLTKVWRESLVKSRDIKKQ